MRPDDDDDGGSDDDDDSDDNADDSEVVRPPVVQLWLEVVPGPKGVVEVVAPEAKEVSETSVAKQVLMVFETFECLSTESPLTHGRKFCPRIYQILWQLSQ